MRLSSWVRDFVDFCYPGVCAACEAPCDGDARVCDECREELAKLESAPACEACGKPLAQAGAPCPFCAGKGVPYYERVIRLGVFDDPLKEIIHRIKYHGRWTLAEYVADRLWAQPRVKALLAETERLVAVPLHPLRQIFRGFNQSQLIAKSLSRLSDARLARPIIRIKHTESQTHLRSRAQRDQNVREAFGLIRPGSIERRRVVVVDDVTTSGATLLAVARAMKDAEPKSLSAIVVAVADPRHYDFQVV